MTKEELWYLAGAADALAGTARPRTVEEARSVGEQMQRLVAEVARLTGIELPTPTTSAGS